ncbi:hypothetical protein RRG08_009901 [Elysia crispata]|uniref:Uncharacterized protein n=1 Tax=Elysia crispata TaxID=231223 RepID=A0AAE1CV93_9GAST|nr:hypothetical protein RRG08_009901 [Elysia crispata]
MNNLVEIPTVSPEKSNTCMGAHYVVKLKRPTTPYPRMSSFSFISCSPLREAECSDITPRYWLMQGNANLLHQRVAEILICRPPNALSTELTIEFCHRSNTPFHPGRSPDGVELPGTALTLPALIGLKQMTSLCQCLGSPVSSGLTISTYGQGLSTQLYSCCFSPA